jgi:uncharacterized protein (TIGR03000 family)
VVYTYGCGGCYGTAAPSGAPAVQPEKPKEKLPSPKKEASAGEVAMVIIAAPEGVRVTVNGKAIAMKSAEEKFITPELEPDANYSYTVTAEAVRDGQVVSKTRKVMVKAGLESRVDFRELAAAPVGSASIANR